MLRLDNKPIPMVELFISNILGKRFVVNCTEYKNKIPKYFRVIRDIENIEDIFESYLKSLAYCKNMT